MRVFGIETSCDETAAAVVDDGRIIRSNVISSQIALHAAHGGVVPELAARGQVEAIIPVVRAALAEAEVDLGGIDAIAYTQGPGLAGSLLVGVNVAKALALGTGLPSVPVNHLEAHVYANWLTDPDAAADDPLLPAVCLLVSGGHTELLSIGDDRQLTVLGRTLDDAAGEAFDKGARLLGLGYPGGPAIQDAARTGDPTRFALPRSALAGSFDFSFSGLKTALLRAVEPYRDPVEPSPVSPDEIFPRHRPRRFRADAPIADLAASFEAAVVDALVVKTVAAAEHTGARSVLLAGGVAANRRLREALTLAVDRHSGSEAMRARWPDLAYCTDNAAMVAGLGYRLFRDGARGSAATDARPRLPIGTSR